MASEGKLCCSQTPLSSLSQPVSQLKSHPEQTPPDIWWRAVRKVFLQYLKTLPSLNVFQSNENKQCTGSSHHFESLSRHILNLNYCRELQIWFHVQLCYWLAVWPWGITWCYLKKKDSKNKQTKSTARDFEIELSGVLKFSPRTYFCNLSLTNCCCGTEQKWEFLDQYLLSLHVCSAVWWGSTCQSVF